MKSKELYSEIKKELKPNDKNVMYDPFDEKEITIIDEKGQKLKIKAWYNSKGYIHFRTLNHSQNEQYRFTGEKELKFEGWC